MINRKPLAALIAALMCLSLLLTGCQPAVAPDPVPDEYANDGFLPEGMMPNDRAVELREIILSLGDMVVAGDFASIITNHFDAIQKKIVTPDGLKQEWEKAVAGQGELEAIIDTPEAIQMSGWEEMELAFQYTRAIVKMNVRFRLNNEIAGMSFRVDSIRAQDLDEAGIKALCNIAELIIDMLEKGRGNEIINTFGSESFKEYEADYDLAGAWETTKSLGALKKVDVDSAKFKHESDSANILRVPVEFELDSFVLELTFNGSNELSMLYFLDSSELEFVEEEYVEPEPPPEPPASITETYMQFESQVGYPLYGSLTVPKDKDPVAAVILLHGNGPCDRDETVGANAPLREIAWGLSEQGLAVLRYDKITFGYGAQLESSGRLKKFTVEQEVVLDALAAIEWLKQQPGIDPNKVFILGHNIGGTLASYIQSRGAGAAGLILMGASPRKLWDVMGDQYARLAEDYLEIGDADTAKQITDFLTAELERAAKIANLTDDEALNPENDVLRYPAWYLRHLEGIDPIKLMVDNPVPVLVMQGELDRQVFADTDYAIWQEGLANLPDARFILYPKLNHIMGEYTGEPTIEASEEYDTKTPVHEQVIADIADFVTEYAK